MENKNFDRRKYLNDIVSQMINKSKLETITNIYDFYSKLLKEDTDINNKEINLEKQKILDNCYAIFRRADIRASIIKTKEKNNFDNKALVDLISNIISEKILGDNKRTYSMSHKYSENTISTEKNINFTPITRDLSINLIDDLGHQFLISKIGTLSYHDGIMEESIDKFRIVKKINEKYSESYEVFSQIDFYKLETDENYKQVVLNELLSANNIELSNAGGYIGEITDTRNNKNRLKPGEQLDNPQGFYTYQISPDFALTYDSIPLTAVMLYGKNRTNQKTSTSQGR